MHDKLKRDPGSFRDPSSHVLIGPEGVYRSFRPAEWDIIANFLTSPAYQQLLDEGLLIQTERVSEHERRILVDEERIGERQYVRHPRLSFLSYPYEWSAEMLLDAARCTLAVQALLLKHGWSLKDASAYNVQFRLSSSGPTPTFIDVGSIERLPVDGLWRPYRQFLGHFLLPLLLYRTVGYDFREALLANIDGVDSEQAYRIAGLFRRLVPPYLSLVTLPRWLRRWEAKCMPPDQATHSPQGVAAEKAQFTLGHLARSLQRHVDRLGRRSGHSVWSGYEETSPYTARARVEKEEFVRMVCDQVRPSTVLDLGSNVGTFSFIAAASGATVIAVDNDLLSLDRLYHKAREQGADILPIRMDIANPSPGIGWRNRERLSFLERIDACDGVLALAVVHHLSVGMGIPLEEIVRLLSRLTRKMLVVELVDPSDAMFQALLRGRQVHGDQSLNRQEQLFQDQFTIRRRQPLTGMRRCLYVMYKR